MDTSDRSLLIVISSLLFIFLAAALAQTGAAMFADTDPLWHLAAGDVIREIGELPEFDPAWAFTAENYRWLNISWGWDTLISIAHEYLGWYGPAAINAMTIALAITLVFATCWMRSKSFFASAITTFLYLTTFTLLLRPLQVSNLFVAIFMLVLGMAFRAECKTRWLALLPLLEIFWVNMHGGFLLGPILTGAFFLHAWWQRTPLARPFLLASGATLVAVLINPYGIDIIEAAWRPLTDPTASFTQEWQPLWQAPKYLLLFPLLALLPLALCRRLPVLTAERWLSGLWLLLALSTMRYLPIFATIAAPAIACALAHGWQRVPFSARLPALPHLNSALPKATLALSCLTVMWLLSPYAARHYQQETLEPHWTLAPEIVYLEAHYPQARVFNHFNLGSILLYETHGEVPVFIDARTSTAIPRAALDDYIHVMCGDEGWEDILTHWKIDAVMLDNATPAASSAEMLARFRARKDWKEVFTGSQASIFVRSPKAAH